MNPAAILFFLVALVLAAPKSHAATVPITQPLTVGQVSGGFVANSFSNFMAQAINGTPTAPVGTTTANLPAKFPLAATAGTIAATALRAGGVLATSSLIGWAAGAGLQYLQGQWQKSAPSSSPNIPIQSTAPTCAQLGAPGNQILAAGRLYKMVRCQNAQTTSLLESGWTVYQWCSSGGGAYPDCQTYAHLMESKAQTVCPTGYTMNGAYCVPDPVISTPTQADWDNLATKPLTDAAATDLAKAGIPLPLKSPEFTNPYEDVPYGYPKTSPTTGQKTQPMARVTPAPDGKTADIQLYEKPVNADGTPTIDPATGQPKANTAAPEPPFDLCKEHPEIVACIDKGPADDLDLETQNRGTSITPVSVGGSATCPPDKTISIHGGSVVMSYQPYCDLATMIRPLILAFAWLAAGYILLGVTRD